MVEVIAAAEFLPHGAVCKGSIAIGTGCLECEKCKEEALKLVVRFRDDAAAFRGALREIELEDSDIIRGGDGELEVSRNRLAEIAYVALSIRESKR